MIGVCGEALIDFTPIAVDGAIAYAPRPGGSPCNVAIGLARLGKKTALISKISGDAFGDLLRAHLTENDVDLRWLARGSEPSALAFVIPSADGGHDFAFYGVDTAEQRLMIADVPDSFPDELTALHFGSYSLMLGDSARTYEALMRREHGNRVISLDPNVRPSLFPDRDKYRARIEGLLPFATVVKASEDDLAWLHPDERPVDVAARWLSAGPALVVVTLGAKGAFAKSATDVMQSAAPKVNVADTVGAGDAFMSALLAHLDDLDLLHRDALAMLSADAIIDVLEYANRAAAIACTRIGADPPKADVASGLTG
ncbi:MAG: carbohydrate kinase [Chloroflexi bacterium]|nr:carbohydrate kinase [Chloroflexota bacterium]